MKVKLPPADLSGYRAFIDRVDQFCHNISSTYASEITCKAGCSSCCLHISLFPIEAAVVAEALAKLPIEMLQLLASRIDRSGNEPCPLLVADHCVVYQARPLICRTHGLPLLIESDGVKRVTFCEDNFQGVAALPGSAVLNLETLNSTLAALNSSYAADTRQTADPCARVTIAAIIKSVIASEDKI